jgi:hypothetical protein
MELSQAERRSRVRASQLWRSPTMAMPEKVEPARAQNSVTPKSLKKAAVIQSMRGGFSSHKWEFQCGTSQLPPSISRETSA